MTRSHHRTVAGALHRINLPDRGLTFQTQYCTTEHTLRRARLYGVHLLLDDLSMPAAPTAPPCPPGRSQRLRRGCRTNPLRACSSAGTWRTCHSVGGRNILFLQRQSDLGLRCRLLQHAASAAVASAECGSLTQGDDVRAEAQKACARRGLGTRSKRDCKGCTVSPLHTRRTAASSGCCPTPCTCSPHMVGVH